MSVLTNLNKNKKCKVQQITDFPNKKKPEAMADPAKPRYIQLTKLPNLKEVNHVAQETSVDRILAKAIALQLKPLNAEMTKFAFDHLLMLIDDQLDEMIGQLHRISNIQRRESMAKCDIQLFLQGFNVSPSDLDVQGQLSQYISLNFKKEYDSLHAMKESYAGAAEDDVEQIENVLTTLVPPSNSLKYSIPRWFPALPPDHTYKFTPQFNHPITDEVMIRKKIVEEGKNSELALLHLLDRSVESTSDKPIPDFDEKLAAEETNSIYGFSRQKKQRNFTSSSSTGLFCTLPQTNFNVEEYARSRVEIARRKVVEFEQKALQLETNPFLKGSRLIISSNDKITKKQVNREIKTMLRRSFFSMLKSIPDLQIKKKHASEDAEKKRDERLAKMKILHEQKRKETNEKVKNGEINLLDLAHQDEFFGSLDSSDEEGQSGFNLELQSHSQPQEQSREVTSPEPAQDLNLTDQPIKDNISDKENAGFENFQQDPTNGHVNLDNKQQGDLSHIQQHHASSEGDDDGTGFLFNDIANVDDQDSAGIEI
ncbi:hypothetical protein HG535_0A07740 [Zygotorulaspora mrakii]|uniref:Transcription initiation factor TFIID subunit 8 n=1 Tax=Zygotorulaspora mrakii TaxID=42260 RepID=A0A7H9AZ19_ZYGMR|nr:uncharacterized protein HG535_0A07740 [Zygotorulaspora mrakii]QLG70832.1 hypothetical protein HG535_0A07740 [Zygotorulaspora mrakii]